MTPKKTSSKNFHNRVIRFKRYVELQGEDGQKAFEAFDKMLDSLHNEDFFGTEGQSDPRGDRRG